MPSDLIRYKEEIENDPSMIDFYDCIKFKNNSVHAMKLNTHSYYLKN